MRDLVVGLSASRREDAHQSPIRIKAVAGRALESEPRWPLAALAAPDNDRFPAVST